MLGDVTTEMTEGERTARRATARVSAAGDARVRREVPGIMTKNSLRNG